MSSINATQEPEKNEKEEKNVEGVEDSGNTKESEHNEVQEPEIKVKNATPVGAGAFWPYD